MALVDVGPLIALIDKDDDDHARCIRTLPLLAAPLLTTLPALT